MIDENELSVENVRQMKILVLSDIHANLTALEAVLADAGSFNAAWCLGDLVGYGPDGNECVQRIRNLPNLLCIKGNHELAICGEADLSIFNQEAAKAILISKDMLSAESLNFLKALPEVIATDLATLAHGSPRNPIWEYTLDPSIAAENFEHFHTQLAFIGHTHIPLMFNLNDQDGAVARNYLLPQNTITLSQRAMLNPGSVGQPRDNDPRASFGIFDPVAMTWEIHRVSYDIAAVQQRIIEAGLPEKHARRLSGGW